MDRLLCLFQLGTPINHCTRSSRQGFTDITSTQRNSRRNACFGSHGIFICLSPENSSSAATVDRYKNPMVDRDIILHFTMKTVRSMQVLVVKDRISYDKMLQMVGSFVEDGQDWPKGIPVRGLCYKFPINGWKGSAPYEDFCEFKNEKL